LQNATKSFPKKLHIRAIKIGGNQLIAIATKARQKNYRFEQLELGRKSVDCQGFRVLKILCI
jgi:hypothetical protein